MWVGSTKHNPDLLVSNCCNQPTAPSTATNWWAQKSACLNNNCQCSGVGSDWGRGDLHNVIFDPSDIRYVFVSIFIIRKGPTPFPLLPQSCSSHYPRDEEYRRIAFLLPAQFLSFYCLWRQAGDSSPYAQICSTVTFWWSWFQTCVGEKAGLHPRLINYSLSALINNSGKLPHLISWSVLIKCQMAFLPSTKIPLFASKLQGFISCHRD